MKLIYNDINGNPQALSPSARFLSTLEGSTLDKMKYLANKDLPTGTKYEIIEDSVLPALGTVEAEFFGAFEVVLDATAETSMDLTSSQLATHNMKENK